MKQDQDYIKVPRKVWQDIRATLSLLDDLLIEAESLCFDCGNETLGNGRDYYMVNNDLWDEHGTLGMLCIDCLEGRLGRQLTANDFNPHIPVNRMNAYMCSISGLELLTWDDYED